MKTRSILFAFALAGLTAFGSRSSQAAVRVALMDFSTDDNSYRSIQAAADFTSLVQIGLADESGIEWVERAQVHLAKAEFALAEMNLAGDASPIRRGRMLGANWLVTGHFSTDDRERHTLTFQVVELERSDVIARDTLLLPESSDGAGVFGCKQSESAVAALHRLLVEAKMRTAKSANEARVAFLFLSDLSSFPFSGKTGVLNREFRETLEREATSNSRIRVIEFPKAYQSTEEAEMAVDGIIEAGHESWKPTADLYVWGTYTVTNEPVAGRQESKLHLALSLWDGTSQPSLAQESLNLAPGGGIPAELASDLIRRLVKQVMDKARIQTNGVDTEAVRRQIAASIVKAYTQKNGRVEQLVRGEKEALAQDVHMLETACFFDPDSTDARLLWLTCRYGWWIDFGQDVKNEFWTKWRRSQAWAKYVERFGLKPSACALPFPYNVEGIPSTYVKSLEDALELFPQWHSKEEMDIEDKWHREGTHTWLAEAKLHGFPKDMPHDLAFKWRQGVEVELARRKKKAADYSLANASGAGATSTRTLTQSTAPASITTASKATPVSRPLHGEEGTAPGGVQITPKPGWLTRFHSTAGGMFRLYPPDALPGSLKPEVETIQFPSRYEVKVVNQMAYHNGQLWILAMDERSSLSSDPVPDLSSETLNKRNRLWRLEAISVTPSLYEPDSLPAGINSVLFRDGQLWLATDTVSVWDLTEHRLRKFGLADGLAIKGIDALAEAGGYMIAAGGSFEIGLFGPDAPRWAKLDRPPGRLSHGTGYPFLLGGNERSLGYVAGGVFFYDFKTGTWTNLAAVKEGRCFAVDNSTFWIGADNGLNAYDPEQQTIRSWTAPTFIESPTISLGGMAFSATAPIGPQRWEEAEAQVQGLLRKIQTEQRRVRIARLNRKEALDPLRLNTRIAGKVSAVVNDGEFLWLGMNNYFGCRLLLIHKPSQSLVAGLSMEPRNQISSLAVSDKYVWVGTGYGDQSLLRMRKDSLLSVPRSQWKGLALKTEEREQLLRGMSQRDQAIYAFYAGDDERVVQLLAGLDSEKASLEEMFALAWSYDAVGVDDSPKAQAWFDRISARFPDSPWAKSALEFAKANLALYDKFDHNHGQKLDLSEKQEMLKDEEALGLKIDLDRCFESQMDKIFKMCDTNGDGRLDRREAHAMWSNIPLYFNVGMEITALELRTIRGPYIDAAGFEIVKSRVRQAMREQSKWQQ